MKIILSKNGWSDEPIQEPTNFDSWIKTNPPKLSDLKGRTIVISDNPTQKTFFKVVSQREALFNMERAKKVRTNFVLSKELAKKSTNWVRFTKNQINNTHTL